MGSISTSATVLMDPRPSNSLQPILNPFTGQLVNPVTMEPVSFAPVMQQVSSKLKSLGLQNNAKVEGPTGSKKLVNGSNDENPKELRTRPPCHFGFHAALLNDKRRVKVYKNVIIKNKHLFKEKVVLVLDCGSGLLPMLAAKTGASRVIAYDQSSISYYAEEVFKANGLDNKITTLHGEIQDLVLPGGIDKVDIIISEWMGFCLARESSLDSFIYARNKWLKEDGLLFPNKCTLYITGIEAYKRIQDHVFFWRRPYEVSMKCLQSLAFSECSLLNFRNFKENVAPQILLEVDMKTVSSNFLNDFETPFELVAKTKLLLDSLAIYFTVDFDNGDFKVKLSSAPNAPRIYWKPTVCHLKEKIFIDKGEIIQGNFCMKYVPYHRELQFEITVSFKEEINTYNRHLR